MKGDAKEVCQIEVNYSCRMTLSAHEIEQTLQALEERTAVRLSREEEFEIVMVRHWPTGWVWEPVESLESLDHARELVKNPQQ